MTDKHEKKGYLMEDFRLFHLRDAQGMKIDYHYHEFYKILFLISGSGGYSIEGKRYLLKAGDLVLIEQMTPHRPEFESGVPYERMILYISPEFLIRQSTADCDLTQCFKSGHVLRPKEPVQNHLNQLLAILEKEISADDYGKTIMSNSILLHILIEVMRSQQSGIGQKPEPVLPKNKRILDIVRYLDSNLTEQFTIDDLAEQFYMSRFHMMRMFKEETGTTIHNYVSDRRLLMARDLIAKGTAATDACFACGFQNYASFSRAYSKLFGTTPTGRKHNSSISDNTFE